MSPKNTRLKKNKRVFYVGAPNLAQMKESGYVTTLDGAIKQAIEKAENTEQDQIVVQIVRKIRVLKRPTRVETVS